MKTLPTLVLAASLIAACKSSKKTVAANPAPASNPAAAPASTTAPAPAVTGPVFNMRVASDVVAPSDLQLKAIQATYSSVNLETLKQGHSLYTGVCMNCHAAKSIYRISEQDWPGIIDNMAVEAKITNVEKDAVLKYVLSIKATQPK